MAMASSYGTLSSPPGSPSKRKPPKTFSDGSPVPKNWKVYFVLSSIMKVLALVAALYFYIAGVRGWPKPPRAKVWPGWSGVEYIFSL